MSFTVDGVEWNIPCTIERTAEITASEISGLLLNRNYFNDVLGTYMRYTVSVAIPKGKENDYAGLYEVLTSPRDGHAFKFPYNQSTISITARVLMVSDKYVKLPNGKQTWRYTRFDVVANHPSKSYQAEEIITHGLSPTPEAPSANYGDVYEFTENGWMERFYADADSISY